MMKPPYQLSVVYPELYVRRKLLFVGGYFGRVSLLDLYEVLQREVVF